MKNFLTKIGAFLVTGTMLTVMAGNLVACSKKEAMSVGQFLTKTADAFGMANYTTTEPYFDNIDSDNAYYEIVQMAGDRDAFTEYSSLSPEDDITQEMAALILVNVSDLDEYSEASSDVRIRNKSKLLNEEKIKVAVSNGLFELSSFDSSFSKNKELSEQEATEAIEKAVSLWADRHYENKLEYEVAERVIDLSLGDDAISPDDFSYVPNPDNVSNNISENGDNNFSDESEAPVDDVILSAELSKQILSSTGTDNSDSSNLESITLPDGTVLSQGDTYLLPATDDSSMQAFIVDEITTDGEQIKISNSSVPNVATDTGDENILISDVFNSLEQMGTINAEEMDLTQYAITDGLGNELQWSQDDIETSDNDSSSVNGVGYWNGDGGIVTLQNAVYPVTATPLIDVYGKKDANFTSKDLNFKVGDTGISGKIGRNSISITAKYSKDGNPSLGLEKTFDISNMSVNYGVRTEWGKLKYAELVANYKVTDTTKLSTEFSKSYVKAPKYTNGNGKFLTNLNRSVLKASDAKGAKSIKICSIPFVTAGPASLNLVLRLNISVSGEVTITFETECSKGFRYDNGNFNFINKENKSNKAEIKGTVEVTLAIGLAIMALGQNICEGDCEFGIGCTASLVEYLIDENNALHEKIDNVNDSPPQAADSLMSMSFDSEDGKHTLKVDYCVDILTYFIVKASLAGDSWVGKMVGSKSWTFCDAKNAKIEALSGHWENGAYVGSCTKDYQEATDEEETTETVENATVATYAPEEKEVPTFDKEDYGNEELKKPLAATMYLNLLIGGSETIVITSLPDGYAASDILFSSDDENVASVSANGVVYAKSEGTTIIQIQTKDGQYATACTVIVKINA